MVKTMIALPHGTMYSDEFDHFVDKLQIPNFVGVYMDNELPKRHKSEECGVLNLQKNTMRGSHWLCWAVINETAYYFDSFGEPPNKSLKLYLNELPIKRCAITVQHDSSKECGSLCLYVLYFLFHGVKFCDILYSLQKRYKSQTQKPLIIDTKWMYTSKHA